MVNKCDGIFSPCLGFFIVEMEVPSYSLTYHVVATLLK